MTPPPPSRPPRRPTPWRPGPRSKLAAFLAAIAGSLNPAPAENPAAPSPIDTLDQASLQETFRLLRSNYIERDTLTLETLNRAALQGLLARLDFGAELVPLAGETTAPDPVPAPVTPPLIVAEPLATDIAYLRPTAFNLETATALDAALAPLGDGANATLILDLRTPGPPADFVVAAQILERFVPAGQRLFSVQKPGDPDPRHFQSSAPPRWAGRLIALVDEDATNVAETIAAGLRHFLKVPLVGTATRGRTMQYDTAPISPTHGLRFASAEMRLPDGSSLFRKGLKPDLAVPSPPAAKRDIFARQPAESVKPFITNPERPRHNEAALVGRTAPELPHLIARAAGNPPPSDQPPLQDPPLQATVDWLVARRALR